MASTCRVSASTLRDFDGGDGGGAGAPAAAATAELEGNGERMGQGTPKKLEG
jgi:hypothetical protein